MLQESTQAAAATGGNAADGRKVQGTSHWVSAPHAIKSQVRQYDRLFRLPNPADVPEGQDWKTALNPDSLQIIDGAMLEPSLAESAPGSHVQFERIGYFFADPVLSKPGAPVWNRTVTDTSMSCDERKAAARSAS